MDNQTNILDMFIKEGLKGKTNSTQKTYMNVLLQFEKWLDGAGTNLIEFARTDVQQYVDYLVANKKSASTINKTFNAIKKFCSWANKNEAVEDISVVKQVDYKKQAPKSLSRKELLQLLREVDRDGNKRDIAIVVTLVNSGLRVSELVALDKKDIKISDRKGEVIVRSGKGNKERIVPLNNEARRSITKYLEERCDGHDALFLSNRDERISVRSVQNLVNKYGFNVHALRHTFITGLVRSGQDISVIQSMSGHSSADMVLRYSAPTEEDKQNAVEDIWSSF